LFLFM